jgi:Cu(I)/Ag(I) efflux system membrane fusion protein
MSRLRLLTAVLGLVAVTALAVELAITETHPFKAEGPAKKQMAAGHAADETLPTYVCPMHPQIVRHEPGKCPICGMQLVLVKGGSAQAGGERKILYYRNPMNPTITSDHPMKDEMGMDYVPVYEQGGVQVQISPAVVENMGVRTALVKRETLRRRIDTVAYVDFDEELLSHVHLRTDGWIEQLTAKSEGEPVKRGDLLFKLYSPTLVNAEEEYLQALSSSSVGLAGASRDRLAALGVSEDQIEQLRKTRKVSQVLKVYASQDGIVAQLNVRQGMYVKPATEVMMLADLSSVWLLAEVFESQAEWVKVGEPAEVRLSYLPGRLWKGHVEFVYPSLDPVTRTLRARLKFPNPQEVLKPNMYAAVTIYGEPQKDALTVPREALIRTGIQDRVILDLGHGHFEPRVVRAGVESGDSVEILAGLRKDDRVVTSGQFLIDSEASLRASILRMSDAASHVVEEPDKVAGKGVIKALDPEKHSLTMQHEPIEAIGWPSMTMDFRVKAGVSLKGLAAGDPVTFELQRDEHGYTVSAIERRQP